MQKEIEQKLYEYAQLKHREESLMRQWDVVIEEKEGRIERTVTSTAGYSGSPKKGSHSDPTFETVNVIIKLYDEKVQSIVAQLSTVQSQIGELEYGLNAAGLTEREWNYIKVRYIEGRPVEAVSEQLHYSETTLKRTRKNIIAKVGPFMASKNA